MKIKKLLISIMLLFVLVGSANAIIFNGNQQETTTSYANADKGNIRIEDVVGSVNEISGTSLNYTRDIRYEFVSVSEKFYITLANGYGKQNITIYYRGDLTENSTLFVQNVTLNENGNYIFSFEPSKANEVAVIDIDIPDSTVMTSKLVEEKPEGFNDIVGGLVNKFEQVIEINIGIWRVVFYGILSLLALSIVAIVFGFAWLLFKYSKKLQERGGIQE